ncbi:MAG TPA: VWA domain-containing protein [Terriglobales bacterium]|nr:VWA domain-containing protein [Terriglobales bacterium]
MQWFQRTYLVLIAALVALPVFAQDTNDLPSAPSAVLQKAKPAPPKQPEAPAPVSTQPTTSENSPASTPPEQAANAESSSSARETSDQPATRDESTFVTTVNEVPVVFTVTDKHNHYVKDLNKEDFKVVDDGRPVEDIRSFRRETDLPLRVGLLIDSSASVRSRFKFEQESAIEFMNQTIRPKYDSAFIMGFDSSLEITQEFTDSSELLSKGIRSLRPGNSTRLYDALYYACRERLLDEHELVAVRKAIVLITDGDDNSSRTTREEAIDMALRANVIVYTISTNFPGYSESSKYDKVLERIADATGGRAFEPFQVTDVANAFAQIQADLRSQYALAYHPADFRHDGRYRTIEILAEHKGLKVHSRHGYYAPTE